MSLKSFDFRSSYNKIDHRIAEEFYIPCMQNSIRYDRVTGYFSSSVYVITWDALREFISKGGRIRIICSPFLSDEDIEAVDRGNIAKRDEIIQRSLQEELQYMLSKDYLLKPSKLLACLISNGIVSVRIAFPSETSHPAVKQLFHDKVGVFYDADGNCVGFRGSLNETYNGLSNDGNIESIDVFQSWDGGKEQIRSQEAAAFFERVWNGETETKLLMELPQTIKETIKEISKNEEWTSLLDGVQDDLARAQKWLPKVEGGSGRKLRDHQFAALEGWKNNGYRGIFEHATGSGKTFTAICAIHDGLIRKKSVIVLVPSVGLLEQWEKELKSGISDLNINYLICGTGHTVWKKEGMLAAWTAPETGRYSVVLSTMDTASSSSFIRQINQGEHLLVVADEVHRIGSDKRSAFLSVEAGDRLGLSATPIRYGDPEGTKAIMTYFGGIVQPVYSLKDAIRDGVLTKYFYYPVSMHLSDYEQECWNDLTRKINKLYAQLITKDQDHRRCLSDPKIKKLLLQRARIVKNASAKVSLAAQIVSKHYKKGQKWIVYCDNKVQLSAVLKELTDLKLDAYEYHSEMLGDRGETLDYFAAFGGILVSIRCLDEGIDIPSTTHALILASSKNPREFIQRRGRILRKAEGKFFSYLYDVVVTPNGELEDDLRSVSIIKSELSRAIQFGEWAENPSCIAELKNIAIDYNIDVEETMNEGEED